jgi:hypothetical protein
MRFPGASGAVDYQRIGLTPRSRFNSGFTRFECTSVNLGDVQGRLPRILNHVFTKRIRDER